MTAQDYQNWGSFDRKGHAQAGVKQLEVEME